MNPDRLICGLAASFREWPAERFADFVASGVGVPLRLDHRRWEFSHITRELVDGVGVCRRFAIVPEASTPAGLLTLGELRADVDPDSLFPYMWTHGQWRGMSIAGGPIAGTRDQVGLTEVSLTREGADEFARVIATGPAALEAWDLLTARPAFERVGG